MRYNEYMNRRPLAEQMRPQKLDEVIGQSHLLGEGELLRQIVRDGQDDLGTDYRPRS